MRFKTKFLIILLIFIVLNIAAVSAIGVNVTDSYQLDGNDSELIVDDYLNGGDDSNSFDVSDDANITEEVEVIKSTPKISVKSTKVKSKDTLTIYLKNSSGDPIKSKKLTASIGSKKYSITTNSKGAADLNINLAAKTHKVTVSFEGDDKFNPISRQFSIKVSKLATKITCYTNFVVRGNYLYFYLTDQNSNAVLGKKIIIKYKGKTLAKKPIKMEGLHAR